MDTIGPDAISAAAKASPLQAEYGQTIDRESAYERLNAKVAPPEAPPPPVSGGGLASASGSGKISTPAPEGPSMVEEVIQSSAFKSFIRSAATVAGREITRSVFGTGTRRRR
jgi:hypothetical protein